MIVGYKYCGYTPTRFGNKLIWGAVTYILDGHTKTYLFWGSPKNPIIREYTPNAYRSKKEQLHYRIKEKQKSWSGYTQVPHTDINTEFPELDTQIGMYVLAKKLKSYV